MGARPRAALLRVRRDPRRKGGRSDLGALWTARTARLVRTLLEAAGRAPDFDHFRLGRRDGGRLNIHFFQIFSGRMFSGRTGFLVSALGKNFRRHRRGGFYGCRLARRRFDLRRLGRRFDDGRLNLGNRVGFDRGNLGGRRSAGACRIGRSRRGVRCRRGLRRLCLHRFGLAIHAVAERAQDRGKIFAGGAGERGHRASDREAAAVEHAVGLRPRRGFAPGQRRADQVGEPLQDIDAHGTLAGDPIAGGAVQQLRRLLVDRDRRAARGGEMQQIGNTLGVGRFMLERP